MGVLRGRVRLREGGLASLLGVDRAGWKPQSCLDLTPQ